MWQMIRHDVEEARSSFTFVEIRLTKEIFLGMASNLGWGPAHHKALRDPSPIPFPKLLQTHQK